MSLDTQDPLGPSPFLDELEKRAAIEEADEALKNPETKDRLLLTTVLAIRREAINARMECHVNCRPRIEKLERFRTRLLTIWAVLVALGSIVAALLGILT